MCLLVCHIWFISASFTNLDVEVNVDHSTNIGDVVYALMNGNDNRSIEMETSSMYGLNPENDRKYILQFLYSPLEMVLLP